MAPTPVRRIFLLRHAKSDWGDAGARTMTATCPCAGGMPPAGSPPIAGGPGLRRPLILFHRHAGPRDPGPGPARADPAGSGGVRGEALLGRA